MSKEKKLICFDFDNTITQGPLYGFLLVIKSLQPLTSGNSLIIDGNVRVGVANPGYKAEKVKEYTEEFLNDSNKGIKNHEKLLHCFQTLLHNDSINIAITSFNQYPDAVTTTLEKLCLGSEKDIQKIYCVLGFPSYGVKDPDRKKEHIEAAMKRFKITDFSKVALVDDDSKNTQHAKDMGCVGIHVPDDNGNISYFDEISKFVGNNFGVLGIDNFDPNGDVANLGLPGAYTPLENQF
jgi:Acid Phosphatase